MRGLVALLCLASSANAFVPSTFLSRPRQQQAALLLRRMSSSSSAEEAEKFASEAAALRAEISAMEGTSGAPAPAPAMRAEEIAAAEMAAAKAEAQERFAAMIAKQNRGGISSDMKKRLEREAATCDCDDGASAKNPVTDNPILAISVVVGVLAIAVSLS